VDGGEGIDVMDGGAGFDILSYASSATGVYVSLATGDAWGGNAAGDVFRNFEGLRGSGAHDSLIGSNGDDVMFGFRGNDMLRGGGGNDRLLGEEGDDTLTGGNGLDVLRGGSGADLFRYHDIAESTVAARGRDRLMDFARLEGDRIDLQFIDADTTQAGDQAFSFIGAAAFGGIAGQLRYVALTDTTLVQADVDGDAAADFSVQIAGNLLMLGADFIL